MWCSTKLYQVWKATVFITSTSFKIERGFESKLMYLKGLGHAILGNFCTDQIVIELTKI